MIEKDVIIRVNQLKKHFPLPKKTLFQKEREYVKAVNDVSFEVERGETFGIVGESGSGKSTVARLANLLIRPTDGEVFYKEQNILNFNKKEKNEFRKQVQMVFQSPYGTLDPRRSIEYSLREPFVIHDIGTKVERDEKIRHLLELVNLPQSSLNKFPHELSGGQLQRVNIARAVALDPEVVICDESVSALDVSVQAQILNLLNDLQEELNLTYIFISHDLNVVRYMCNQIAVMHSGKIVEMNPADNIYTNPQEEYTKKLLSATPINSPHERRA